METRVYLYEGAQVTFRSENGGLVSATEMAKPFGKSPGKWLELASTKQFISTLCNIRVTDIEKLIYTERGGTSSGTWFHKDLAVEFARWLNPAFAIWCNDCIQELMRHGVTATPAKLEEMLADPDTLITTLQALKSAREAEAAERAARLRTEESLQLATATLQKQQPLVKYATDVLDSNTLIKTTIIAQQLGMTAERLNKKLAAAGIQFRQGKDWVLYSKYVDKGLAGMKTHTFPKPDGSTGTSQQLCWTEAGRKFILERFANR